MQKSADTDRHSCSDTGAQPHPGEHSQSPIGERRHMQTQAVIDMDRCRYDDLWMREATSVTQACKGAQGRESGGFVVAMRQQTAEQARKEQGGVLSRRGI